ncbi:hypothetical protein EDD86DRAFT_275058 [Gorgonomyces haynaldii]|nr:hypothetical protein EDD86DRAFT_275058 [Gorgonomyces haynaldii]
MASRSGQINVDEQIQVIAKQYDQEYERLQELRSSIVHIVDEITKSQSEILNARFSSLSKALEDHLHEYNQEISMMEDQRLKVKEYIDQMQSLLKSFFE